MNKNLLFNLILGTMIVSTVGVLGGLGESRLDVYISLFTLEYLICIAVLRPRRRIIDILAIALIAVFFYIVGVRIAEILLT